MSRANALSVSGWRPLFEQAATRADEVQHGLRAFIGTELEHLEGNVWPTNLPLGVIHADLFPDNVLVRGDEITGLIDFYFACTDVRAYDLAVMHTAWSFDSAGRHHDPAIGRALLQGYRSAFPLSAAECGALPILAQGSCIRFALTRAWDWLNTPADAMVTRKDPLAYTRRLTLYQEGGARVFG
jgi:homoserine kinase type II